MITRAHYKDRTNQNPEVQRGKAVTKVVEGIAWGPYLFLASYLFILNHLASAYEDKMGATPHKTT